LYAESSGNSKTDDPTRSVDYTRFRETHEGLPHVTLVIGSESTGINPKIKEITKIPKQQQAVVHIPLANGVDSLNCTNALSVLGFELKRLFEAE
jgi:tRNA G18 (ribose-2'-O)-methylase SpoU